MEEPQVRRIRRVATTEETAPGGLTLRSVRSHIPAACFEKRDGRAARFLLLVLAGLVLAEALALVVWRDGRWMLWPVAWVVTGTLLSSLFMITHDCGHLAFFRSKRLNWVVGSIVSVPVLYPFTQWKLWHDAHHRRNNLDGQTVVDQMCGAMSFSRDTAFIPETTEGLRDESKRGLAWWIYTVTRRYPTVTAGFIPLVLVVFFPLRRSRHRRRLLASLLWLVVAVFAIVAGLVWATGSGWAVVHFWLAPLAVHACWLAYYTLNQHTGHDAPILSDGEWTPLRGQVHGTYNAHVPRLISWLHGGPDFHVAHHVYPSIPSYHLREANDALMASPVAHVVRDRPFSLKRYFRLSRSCQIWDEDAQRYVTIRSVMDA